VNADGLLGTAFWILGVSTRDDRRRILEASDEKSLTLDPSVCEASRERLTNPRTRLTEEMCWLPGVSPKRGFDLATSMQSMPDIIPDSAQLPKLAAFNLRAMTLGRVATRSNHMLLAEEVATLALLGDDLDAASILRDINEDRSIAQFPPARLEQVEDEIRSRLKECAATALRALGKLPTSRIILVMTDLAERWGLDADDPFPEVFGMLVELYEVEAQQFLQPEAEAIESLCDSILKAASAGEEAILPLIERLAMLVRRWDTVAQPLQLVAYSKGLDHPSSAELGRMLRELSLDLHNDKEMSSSAQIVTELCTEVFAELPEFSERVEEDLDAIRDIAASNESGALQAEEFAREISYSAEVGTFIKHRIALSPQAIEWKDASFALEQIDAIRWGGTRGRYGDSFTISVSGGGRSMEVAFNGHGDVFNAVTSRLWRSVGVRLLMQTLATLKSGKPVRFGDVMIDDTSIYLLERKVFGSAKLLKFPLGAVGHQSRDGSLFLVSADRKAQSVLNYANCDNVQLLATLLSIRRDKDVPRLSDIFRQ